MADEQNPNTPTATLNITAQQAPPPEDKKEASVTREQAIERLHRAGYQQVDIDKTVMLLGLSGGLPPEEKPAQ